MTRSEKRRRLQGRWGISTLVAVLVISPVEERQD